MRCTTSSICSSLTAMPEASRCSVSSSGSPVRRRSALLARCTHLPATVHRFWSCSATGRCVSPRASASAISSRSVAISGVVSIMPCARLTQSNLPSSSRTASASGRRSSCASGLVSSAASSSIGTQCCGSHLPVGVDVASSARACPCHARAASSAACSCSSAGSCSGSALPVCSSSSTTSAPYSAREDSSLAVRACHSRPCCCSRCSRSPSTSWICMSRASASSASSTSSGGSVSSAAAAASSHRCRCASRSSKAASSSSSSACVRLTCTVLRAAAQLQPGAVCSAHVIAPAPHAHCTQSSQAGCRQTAHAGQGSLPPSPR
mmetsp:Transcript_22062/g.52752  ORF Transcript_22062/g.52752 Transcript_22062/m.52752 type:complete len:321 (-) Transcript_22062:1160-2122(-)